MELDIQKIIEEIYDECLPLTAEGKVADYIPALAKTDLAKFGIVVSTIEGDEFVIGDCDENFSIQSISKALALTLAFQFVGDKLWERVGKEPSGNPFNSLIQLESESGIPRNPFINAGALVIDDILLSNCENAKSDLLKYIRMLSANENINFNSEIAESEKQHGFRNAALVNFMKSFGNINNPVTNVLDFYFNQCSIMMNCRDLAKAFLFLSNHGIVPSSGRTILSKSHAKRLSSLMLTCGLYDESGDFAFRVGLPGKSGVGGGIVALIPQKMCIAVWSPGLNKYGNSLAGIQALELFTTKTGISIF